MLVLFLTSCQRVNNSTENINYIDSDDIYDDISDKYIDTNPIKVGLYLDNKLVDTYNTTFSYNTDVAWFNVYYTNDLVLDNNSIKYNWNKYYNQYENIDNYKIGFYLNFYIDDEEIEQMILDPSEMHRLDNYFYNYLYDDIHQADGSWYSHLEMKDMKDNTLFTSIKLFARADAYKITKPVKLTVFTYDDDDDFDKDGHYRGRSKYTINIINNK